MTQLHARISHAAYLNDNERPSSILNYNYIDDISTPETVVYRNPDNKKVVIGHRGTALSKSAVEDLRSDASIVVGQGLPTFQARKLRGDKVIRQSLKRFGDHEFTQTGHSLGATLGNHFAIKYKQKSVTFSPGIGLPTQEDLSCITGIGLSDEEKRVCDGIETHQVVGDPVSALNAVWGRGKHFYQRPKQINVHSITNFLKPLISYPEVTRIRKTIKKLTIP